MDYKSAALAEINTIADEFPNYTVGQIMHGIISRKPEGVSTKEWLFNISDEDIYTEIEKTKLIERDGN